MNEEVRERVKLTDEEIQLLEGRCMLPCTDYDRQVAQAQIDKVLADPTIGEIDPDQSRPAYNSYYPTTTFTPRYQQARWAAWDKGQLRMLKANFVKLVREDKDAKE